MLKITKCLLVGILLIASVHVNAATGCVPNSNPNKIYLQKLGSNYRSNGTTATLSAGCNWYFNSPQTSCNVNGGIGAGYLATDTPQNCPIDDNIYILSFAFIIAGMYLYRNGYIKKISLN